MTGDFADVPHLRAEWLSSPRYLTRVGPAVRTIRTSEDVDSIRDAGDVVERAVVLNQVVYVGAYYLIPCLVELASTCSGEAKRAVYDILVEIGLGEPSAVGIAVEKEDVGELPLKPACMELMRHGIEAAWRDVEGSHDGAACEAMYFISTVEPDQADFFARLRQVLPGLSGARREEAERWLSEAPE